MKKIILTMCAVVLSMYTMSQTNYLEGDIIYRTFSHYSHPSPQFIDGIDTVCIVIKGNSVHEYHKATGLHTVYDNNERIIMWSDNTKTGFSLPYVVPTPSLYPSLFKTNETKTIDGKEGTLYKQYMSTLGVVSDTELFIADAEVPLAPNAICFLNVSAFGKGYENKIAIKYKVQTYQTGKMKEFMQKHGGDVWSSQASELIRIEKREVNDNEFTAPSDFNIEYVEVIEPAPDLQIGLVRTGLKAILKKINKDLKIIDKKLTMKDMEDSYSLGIYKRNLEQTNAQYLRENLMVTEQVYTERIIYNMEEEWDY